LINLEDIKGREAFDLLEAYSGLNPYLRRLKKEYLKNKRVKLTETQIKYILDNHDKEPILINRVINISKFLGEELKTQEQLKFVPERILIEYILAENEKTFHVYGKLTQKQKESKMYWLPKTQVLDDPYFEKIDIDVDFDKYDNILAKTGKKLYNHQKEGIKFLLSRNGCILADDMGLGKSLQSIVAALESGAENILVVCTSSLKINWQREIGTFTNDSVIIDGSKWKKAKFTIINYDILKNFHTVKKPKKKNEEEIEEVLNRHMVNEKFDLVIIDEAHNLKNAKSIRSEIMVDLVLNHGIEKVWLLTGTPISNRPMDFYNLLKIIRAKIAENWIFFAKRYCDAKKMYRTLKNGKKKKILLTDGASNLDELAAKTRNLILRRLKTDVLDMPDKIIIPVYHELTKNQWHEYNMLWDEYLEKRKIEKKRGPIQKDLVELILLRKFIAMQAISETIEIAENAIEMDKKVIIFTSFTDELNELAEHFGKVCVVHNGPMSDKEKQASVDAFQQNPKIKVFIGNIKSAGVGITLTEANVVIFNSFDWVPGSNEQAEDRAYRIGQKNNVTVYYQLYIDTISIRMWETLKYKTDVISKIIGDKQLSEPEIIEIMTDKLMNEENG
jgi:SWI/SNF-related matrix-associated actin-dependent regulator 1 of chromatin subfamily A